MNIIKKKMLWFALIFLAGLVFLVCSAMGILKSDNFFAIGLALMAVSLVRLFQYYRIAKDDEKLRQYVVSRTEERVVFLGNKSAAWSFWYSIWGEFLAMLIALFLGEELIANVFGYLVCAQIFLYILSYAILKRKY